MVGPLRGLLLQGRDILRYFGDDLVHLYCNTIFLKAFVGGQGAVFTKRAPWFLLLYNDGSKIELNSNL